MSNLDIKSSEISAPLRLKKNKVLRVKITEMTVRNTKTRAAAVPRRNAWLCKVRPSSCNNSKAVETRFPGWPDPNPITVSAPSTPIMATPNKSNKPDKIWRIVTANIFFLSFPFRSRNERPNEGQPAALLFLS